MKKDGQENLLSNWEIISHKGKNKMRIQYAIDMFMEHVSNQNLQILIKVGKRKPVIDYGLSLKILFQFTKLLCFHNAYYKNWSSGNYFANKLLVCGNIQLAFIFAKTFSLHYKSVWVKTLLNWYLAFAFVCRRYKLAILYIKDNNILDSPMSPNIWVGIKYIKVKNSSNFLKN